MKANDMIEEYVSEFRSCDDFIAEDKMRYFCESIDKYKNEIVFIR